MTEDLLFEVEDLVGHLDKSRPFSGETRVSLRLGDSMIQGAMRVDGEISGTVDGVQAVFTASAASQLRCVRCLKEWEEQIEVQGSQHYSPTPDEDGYVLEEGTVDLGAPATDELSLALPAAPLCSEDCKGLCPICGTDLNSDPCDGHGESSDSPFAVLKDLFDS